MNKQVHNYSMKPIQVGLSSYGSTNLTSPSLKTQLKEVKPVGCLKSVVHFARGSPRRNPFNDKDGI